MKNLETMSKQLAPSKMDFDTKNQFDIKSPVDSWHTSNSAACVSSLPDLKENAKHIVQYTASSISFDIKTQMLYEAILSLKISENSNIPQAKVFGLGEPFYISMRHARSMLSLDEQGNIIKTNEHGKSCVTPITVNETCLYFKTNVQNSGGFLVEQAVYQMSLLLGGDIITPTRLLIVEMPNHTKHTVQVSLGVKGEHLQDILSLATGLPMLKTALGEKQFQEDFIALLDAKYYQEWLKSKGFDKSKLSFEQLLEIFVKTLCDLSSEKRPLEYQRKITTENLKKDLLDKGLKLEDILPSLAFMSRYPELCASIHLADLLAIPDMFNTLKRLYPRWVENIILNKLPAAGLIEEVLNLMKRFDRDNITRHFLLALLSEPQDHKGDNLKVVIEQNAEESVISMKIIGIDNDMAMEGAVKIYQDSRKNIDQVVLVKTMFYGVSEFLREEVSVKMRQSLLATVPENFVSQWLGSMLDYVEEYRLLLTENFLDEKYLSEQIPHHFAEKLFERLKRIMVALKEKPTLSLESMLLFLEPLLAIYFQELRKLQPTAIGLNKILFSRHKPDLQALLLERMQDVIINGKTVQTSLQELTLVNRYVSYEDLLKEYCAKHKIASLRPNDSQEKVLTLHMQSDLYPEKLQRLELVLLFEVFTRLYSKYGQTFIHFIRIFRSVAFFVSTDSRPISFSDPDILFFVMPKTQSTTLPLQGLLAYGVAINKAVRMGGISLLHFAVQHCTAAIPILVRAKVRVDLEDDEKRTPLDLAIEQQNIPAIQTLLLLGAGSFVELKKALHFIETYIQERPDLCQMLLEQNAALAWNVALTTVSQKEKTYLGDDKEMQAEEIMLEGTQGLRYLSVKARKQIYKEGVALGFPKANSYGRHNTIKLNCSIDNKVGVALHLKEYPEFFGREIMVHHLAKHLFGFITPQVALWRFSKLEGFWTKKKKGYPILASRWIAGNTLQDAIDYSPHQLTQLDKQSVSEAIVLAMLINPEDGRADQYMLEPVKLGSQLYYRIVSIDNDRAFIRPIALDDNGEEIAGPTGLQVKTILFCLDEMMEPLHERVREKILALDPYKILTSWLEDLKKEQDTIDGTMLPRKMPLFSKAEKEELIEIGINLDLVFKPSVVIDIYQKLIRLQEALKKHPLSCGLDLLRRVSSTLSLRYRKAFQEGDSAGARFKLLTPGCFNVQEMKEPVYKLYLWPNSKINLKDTPECTGNAIVLAKEETERGLRQAYCIRNGHWVTLMGKVASLKIVNISSKIPSCVLFKEDGLAIADEKSKQELNKIIQTVVTSMRGVRHCHMTKIKAQSIHIMTGEIRVEELKLKQEQAATPAVAIARLKAVYENQSKLEIIRDELQRGELQTFLSNDENRLSNDQKAIIINGKRKLAGESLEFSGIDFSLMKLSNGQPNITCQSTVLKAMHRIEFQTLQIKGCEVLTDTELGNILRFSSGLYSLSLIDCPQLTNKVIKVIKNACSQLKKLELNNIKVESISESLPSLTQLRITNCRQFKSWTGECLKLDKLELINCPLILPTEFCQQYPFLFSLSSLLKSSWSAMELTTVGKAIKTYLKEKGITLKLLSFETRKSIHTFLKHNVGAIYQVDWNFLCQRLLVAIKQKEPGSYYRARIVSTLGKLGRRLNAEQLNSVIKGLEEATKNDEPEFINYTVRDVLCELHAKLSAESLKPVQEGLQVILTGENQITGGDENLLVSNIDNNLTKLISDLDSEQLKSKKLNELLIKLKTEDWYVESNADYDLAEFSSSLSAEQRKLILEELLCEFGRKMRRYLWIKARTVDLSELINFDDPEFEGPEGTMENDIFNVLILLGSRLNTDQLQCMLKELLTFTLRNDCKHIREAGINVLCKLGSNLSAEQLKPIRAMLLIAVKNKNEDIKNAASNALTKLSSKGNVEQFQSMIEELVIVLKDKRTHVKSAAIDSLSNFAENLKMEQLKSILAVLLQAIKNTDTNVWKPASLCLKRFFTKLPLKHLDAAVKILLNEKADAIQLQFTIADILVYVDSNKYLYVWREIKTLFSGLTVPAILMPKLSNERVMIQNPDQTFGEIIFNTFNTLNAYKNYRENFGKDVCDLIADYATCSPNLPNC